MEIWALTEIPILPSPIKGPLFSLEIFDTFESFVERDLKLTQNNNKIVTQLRF